VKSPGATDRFDPSKKLETGGNGKEGNRIRKSALFPLFIEFDNKWTDSISPIIGCLLAAVWLLLGCWRACHLAMAHTWFLGLLLPAAALALAAIGGLVLRQLGVCDCLGALAMLFIMALIVVGPPMVGAIGIFAAGALPVFGPRRCHHCRGQSGLIEPARR